MKKTLLSLTMAAAVTAFAFMPANVHAAYGTAGCGLGAVVIGGGDGFLQVSAATTNASFYSQTIGILLGTSECTDSGVIKAEVEQKVYAFNNFETLKKEMAKGEGESLYTFAHLMGCSAEAVPAFGQMTQANYGQIVSDSEVTPESMLNSVKELAKNDSTLSGTCSAL
ncbi:MAG: DUF3015 domain-containing protein [Spirochaetia bacterium]|nr:DUF3015 domain-containing protein [Spirochaetia bacterium]